MDENAPYSRDNGGAEAIECVARTGMTCDCLRVQVAVRNLAEYLASAGTEHELLPLSLQAVRQTRQDLKEHAADIEGPAGLFQYISTSAPHLMEQILCLSWQHAELAQLLEELEGLLASYNAGDTRALAGIHRRALRLLAALRQHQDSAGQLKMAATKYDA